ncbi:4-vinyl reductase [Blautia schinkii]|nr:4-vinyl reductase [Blautia schinkii]
MANIFFEEPHHIFTWNKLGNVKEGRTDLGEEMPVIVYRLLEYTMNHVLAQEFGVEKADELFRKAGYLAGTEFAKNVLDLTQGMDAFIAELQKSLKDLRIGILRIEEMEEDGAHIVLTVAQDLDCSGLPPTNEVVCNYDEGFLAGILEAYTKKPYNVREIDCWASGDRVCRFRCSAADCEGCRRCAPDGGDSGNSF